ncbi:enterotoxin A family protein [Klebsiella sp. BIGb0407]|uniref:enterotoxin A family protein n=1 Tax=Klebsiella sp. BIGb0407 TaxID=2940603 RepID=UPI002168C1E8|nr:enterotoxin A family protein [Klebsiella sp. BIGb0407]MCS3431430.1 pertussis toxin subunit 1 [Klebsiella sp. BIGb0407]
MRNVIYIILLLFSSIQISWGINPANIVYRADLRSITEIEEAEGMWPFSTGIPDDDLANHFSGQAIIGRVSNFVSTTTSLQLAIDHIQGELVGADGNYRPDFSASIYMIRPNSNFYDLDESFRHARNTSTDLIRTSRLNTLIDHYLDWEEWVAWRGFSQQRIMAHINLTYEMYQTFGNQIFDANFWESRWEPYSGYNPAYDSDTGNNQFYEDIVRLNGTMYVVERELSEIDLRFTCSALDMLGPNSMRHESSNDTCPADLHMNIKRVIYDIPLRRKILSLLEQQ